MTFVFNKRRMKYLNSFWVAAFILICVFTGFSCKKTTHPTLPTPGNYRLLSYTKIRTDTAGVIYNDNYRFFYDGSNRLATILFTTSDTSMRDRTVTFSYSADTIFKVITNVNTNQVVERDTFITNGSNQIVIAYTPHVINTYDYLGRLLTRRTETVDSPLMTLQASNTVTSNNIDFVQSTTGTLTANFINLTTPISVAWTFFPVSGAASYTTTHGTVNGLSDQINNYNGDPVQVVATDFNGVTQGIIYGGANWYNQYFGVYGDQANRIGDYLQLQSFTSTGQNIYATTHLLSYIYRPSDTVRVKYTIDADSKVNETDVTFKDNRRHIWYENYKIQYETH